MRIDCVGVIESGYASATSDEAWLRRLLEQFEPLAHEWGIFSRLFEVGGPRPEPGASVSRGPVPTGLEEAYRKLWDFLAREPPAHFQTMFFPPPSVCWASRRAARLPGPIRDQMHSLFAGTGLRDALGVVAIEPGGPGLLVSMPYREEVSVPPRTLRQLTRVTAHLCSALRLRARARGAGRALGGVEAILDPSGRMRHAVGAAKAAPARESLTAAVRAVERARGRLRRTDPEEALAIWLALFEGRWSIVEHAESDGRRFLLARRNEPGIRDPKALAPGERDVLAYAALGHSNKYIAYLLGVAASTVSSRLGSGLRKLGLSTRREAIEMLGSAVAAGARPWRERPRSEELGQGSL